MIKSNSYRFRMNHYPSQTMGARQLSQLPLSLFLCLSVEDANTFHAYFVDFLKVK